MIWGFRGEVQTGHLNLEFINNYKFVPITSFKCNRQYCKDRDGLAFNELQANGKDKMFISKIASNQFYTV